MGSLRMGQCLSVTLLGEGPACDCLARDLGCEAERVGARES